MPGCAAFGCNNRSEKGYTMKCFPRNPALRTLWTERVCRADWSPSKNSFLCNVHFDANQWISSKKGRTKLKRNAVPSIFTITSTRKSPRKRRRLIKVDVQEDIDYVEYLDDCSDPLALTADHEDHRNRLATTIDSNLESYRAMRSHNDERSSNVVDRNGDNKIVTTNGINNDVIIVGSEDAISANRLKREMKSHVESDQDIDDIERKLRWICEGESQPDETIKTENPDDIENGKIPNFDGNIDETILRSKQNGEKKISKNDRRDSTINAKRIRCEFARDAKKILNADDTVNGIETNEKKPYAVGNTPLESMFTIKVTGMDEDVNEIVETLGKELVYKHKSDNFTTNYRNGLVTSVISVTDRSITISHDDIIEPKLENAISSRSETKTNLKRRQNDCQEKISTESFVNDDNSTNVQQLRKKIKFQDQTIRKSTKQLTGNKDSEITTDKLKSKPDEKLSTTKRSNVDDHRRDNENLLRDLSERLVKMDDVNKSLNKRLTENDRRTRKLEWQIRQRNNRIKELNWKLEKASKYLERAEKNTNNYRKKMMTMRMAIGRRKNLEEDRSKDSLRVGKQVESEKLLDAGIEECQNAESIATDENVVYRTVQDIFDESNDCDDDPSIMDTREYFLREFEGVC